MRPLPLSLHAFIKLGWGQARGTWLLRSLSWNPKEKQKQACEAERQYRLGTHTAVVERATLAEWERCSVLNKQQAPREEGRSLEIHGKDSCRKWRLGIRLSIYNSTLNQAEPRASRFQGQPGLERKTPSQNKTRAEYASQRRNVCRTYKRF